MNIDPDSVLAAAVEFGMTPRGEPRYASKEEGRSLEGFANLFYSLGVDEGMQAWRDVFGHLGNSADMAGNAIQFNNDQYESRLAGQKTITEGLQRQIEAEHKKLTMAKMLLNAIVPVLSPPEFVPGEAMARTLQRARDFLDENR